MNGAEQAIRDWHEKKAAHLRAGEFCSETTLIHKKTGLYYQMSSNDLEYVQAYNGRIKRLVAEHGVPEWAPGRRIVLPNELKDLSRLAEPVDNYQPASKKEGWLVRQAIRMWREKPGGVVSGILRLEARDVLVVLGRCNDMAGADVLDTKVGVRMASYAM